MLVHTCMAEQRAVGRRDHPRDAGLVSRALGLNLRRPFCPMGHACSGLGAGGTRWLDHFLVYLRASRRVVTNFYHTAGIGAGHVVRHGQGARSNAPTPRFRYEQGTAIRHAGTCAVLQEITTQMRAALCRRHTEACQGPRPATASHDTSDLLCLRVVTFVRPAGPAWVLSLSPFRSQDVLVETQEGRGGHFTIGCTSATEHQCLNRKLGRRKTLWQTVGSRVTRDGAIAWSFSVHFE